MMNLRHRKTFMLMLAAGTTAMVGAGAASAQEVVYDNTVSALGFYYGAQFATAGTTTGLEIGDQITLGGVGRVITQFVTTPYNAGAANTGTIQVKFYNCPAGGANPGVAPVLWDSGPVAATFPAGQDTITLTVPNITVPNEFVWTATVVLATATTAANQFGPRFYNPPSVGTSGDFFWGNNVTGFPGWNSLFFNGNPVANFGAKVTAQNAVANGACCKTDGTCTDTTNVTCLTFPGAIFQGAATTCAGTSCPQPGACCLAGGACTSTVATSCTPLAGVFSGAGITCAAAACPKQYFYDDNSAENAIGATAAGGAAYFQMYTVVAGAEKITQIEIGFGTDTTINGAAVTAYILSDPNNDGNPTDAVVLAQVPGVISGANAAVPFTPTFVTFDVPDTTLAVGQHFFVGFVFQNEPAGVFPCGLDTHAPQGHSWFGYTAGTFDPNAFAGAVELTAAGLPGNWTIRADATGGAPTCYPNCDHSTSTPCLNVLDFSCFLNAFAAGQTYANCDNSTNIPVLNVLDFSCFLNSFAAGCSAC